MPKLWKFLSKPESEQNAPKVEEYQFAEAADLFPAPDLFPQFDEEELPEEESGPDPEAMEQLRSADPLSYAQIQSESILKDAELQAGEIILRAERNAEESLREAREKAEREGYEEGYQRGLQQGMEEALRENMKAQEEMAARAADDVEAFLKKAEQALDRQLEDNLDDLRDLALAVAEKVVCVSLKSSSDVISRMIQTAVDKRKRREWAHIYIAECDAHRLTSLPTALTTALAELSDRVRIIPMADDEAGTCIIECPDEIIDASAATQMQNIRDLLSSGAAGSVVTSFNLTEH